MIGVKIAADAHHHICNDNIYPAAAYRFNARELDLLASSLRQGRNNKVWLATGYTNAGETELKSKAPLQLLVLQLAKSDRAFFQRTQTMQRYSYSR